MWKRVGELAALDPSFQPFVEAREAVHAPLDDLARMLRDYAAGLDASPDRLQAIEDRLAAIERLKRRYGPTLDEVMARRRAADEELQALDGGSDRLDVLRRAVDALASRYLARAKALSTSRHTAGDRFARALTAELGGARHAAGPNARSASNRWTGDEADWTASGIDRLGLCLSPNVGEELRPLARIASGGELSRVMLAIKTLATTDVPGKTLIFDEVDAGIGGRVADAVGERLRALGRRGQVLCITHLPQVAACGDTHYRVSKVVQDGRTITRVDCLGSEERIDEVARMMGGRDLSAKVRAGARRADRLATAPKAKVRGENGRAKGESERRKSTA